ncbi:MAG: hypothetical protein LC777_10310, partial [Actinobacteria bacterium]|nr:hypothetical protein [Actinomycetota bacterium]
MSTGRVYARFRERSAQPDPFAWTGAEVPPDQRSPVIQAYLAHRHARGNPHTLAQRATELPVVR